MKKFLLIFFILHFTLLMTTAVYASGNNETQVEDQTQQVAAADFSAFAKYLGAAIAIGVATLSSGIAIGKIGSAAMGAVSERPESGGTALILAALAEGISLWGFLIAFFILRN